MNPRLLLAVVALMALLLGLAAWWRSDAAAPGHVTLDGPAHRTLEPVSDELERAPNVAEAANSTPRAAVLPAPRSRPFGDARWTEQPRPSLLVGRVTSGLNGPALEGAVVIAARLGESEDPGPTAFETRSDSAGRFRIESVAAGNWMVLCRMRGHKEKQRAIVVSGGVDVTVDFVLDRFIVESTILVRLRAPGGRPFLDMLADHELDTALLLRPTFVETCPTIGADLPAGASVIPIRATRVQRARSDEWFRVTLEASKSGCCCLLFGDRVLDVAPFGPGTTDAPLVVSLGDLQGMMGSVRLAVVDDATGFPIPGARVSVNPAFGPTRAVETDEQGGALVERLIVGAATVDVSAADHARLRRPFVIRAGIETDLGSLSLHGSVSIHGWLDPPTPESPQATALRAQHPELIHSFDAGPPPDVEVFAYRVIDGVPERQPAAARVDARGEFAFSGLDPGHYLLSRIETSQPPSVSAVEKRNLERWKQVDARFGDVRGVRLPR